MRFASIISKPTSNLIRHNELFLQVLRVIMLAGGCERITALLYETAEEEVFGFERR